VILSDLNRQTHRLNWSSHDFMGQQWVEPQFHAISHL
jgi:hypothetical protein